MICCLYVVCIKIDVTWNMWVHRFPLAASSWPPPPPAAAAPSGTPPPPSCLAGSSPGSPHHTTSPAFTTLEQLDTPSGHGGSLGTRAASQGAQEVSLRGTRGGSRGVQEVSLRWLRGGYLCGAPRAAPQRWECAPLDSRDRHQQLRALQKIGS